MAHIQLLFSPTGGTRKAAEALTACWGEMRTIDLTDPHIDFAQCRLQPDDLVLIALPSFAGRVPALAAQRLRQVQGSGARCALLCVYGNRAYEDTLVEMQDLAESCGFAVIAAAAAIAEHSIVHEYAAGRPDAADTVRLQEFGQTILAQADAQPHPLGLPGNRPYKQAGAASSIPLPTADCVRCGLCALRCPAQAIDPADVSKVDKAKCIGCMRCAALCPHGARQPDPAVVRAIAQRIQAPCAVRKECELYI